MLVPQVNKKYLITGNDSCKYMLVDKGNSVQDIKDYWDTVFEQIKNSSGGVKVWDCFDNFIGNTNVKSLAEILNVKDTSIHNTQYKGGRIRSLKFKVDEDRRFKNHNS